MAITKAGKKLALMVAWVLCFMVSSTIMYEYEIIMNYPDKLDSKQIWLTGAPEALTMKNREYTLFNEGPIGYGILVFTIFSACMFGVECVKLGKMASLDVRELRGFHQVSKLTECASSGGENFV